ncbi:phosphoribosylanthranilate isomerase [Flavobacterium phycosphaerae]|uniref:phosphoribosylanthranilate isomerase n=1 Tax=Flavobacterium phycosphaerae TaxID=2697515 RepID=UPI001F2DF488|nr:phosphoribosylanthranilate isomerase [Flavobacterium phycosphaerae]
MKFHENIAETAALSPDYLGFIFYDKSARYFENDIPSMATSIQKTGVFVNASFDEIAAKVKQHKLDLVQLHGEESPEFCQTIEEKLVKVIKTFNINKQFNFRHLENYFNFCSFYLFDTKGNQYGGNGIAFDWTLLENYHLPKPYFLSGGIGPEKLKELQLFLQNDTAKNCHAIDLNSKFETKPGWKNQETLKTFIQNLKQQL